MEVRKHDKIEKHICESSDLDFTTGRLPNWRWLPIGSPPASSQPPLRPPRTLSSLDMASSTEPAIPDREMVGYRPGGCRNCLVVLLSGALIVVLIALIAVTALHSHTVRNAARPKTQSYGDGSGSVCRLPSCLQLASLLMRNTNRSADPCQNFFNYACGAFVSNQRHGKWQTFTQTTRQDIGARMFAGMNQVLRFPELRKKAFSPLKKRMAMFYESCLADTEPQQPPTRIPWRDRRWLDLDFLLRGRPGAKMLSVEQVVARLMMYRAPLLFEFGPYDEKLDVVGLVPLGLRFNLRPPICYSDIRALTRALLKAAVQEMSAEDAAGIEKTVERVCSAFNKTDQGAKMYEAAFEAAGNATPAALIAAEEGRNPAFSLRRFFSGLVELGALTPDSLDRLRFSLQPAELASEADTLTAEVGAEAFANFAALHFVVIRAMVMGRDVQDAVKRYLPNQASDLLQFSELRVEPTLDNFADWQTCLLLMSNQLPALMTRAYIDEFLPPEHVAKIKEIAEATRVGFSDNLRKADWLEEADRAAAIRKVEAMGINVGYPDIYLDDAFLEAMMGELNVTTNNFNWNYIRTAHLSTKWRLAQLASGRQELWSQLEVQTLAVQAYYVPELNNVFITAGILQPPIFYPNIPEQFLLAGVGFVIGHEIGHAFDPYGHETPFGTKQAVAWNISSLTEERYHDRLPCLEAIYKDIQDDSGLFNKSGQSNSSLGNDFADIMGMRSMMSAFESLPAKNSKWRLPGFEDLSPLQTLLLNSVQLFCDAPTKRFYDEIYSPRHSPDFMRVSGPLRNIQVFAEAFQCPPKSFMNPELKCHFF